MNPDELEDLTAMWILDKNNEDNKNDENNENNKKSNFCLLLQLQTKHAEV